MAVRMEAAARRPLGGIAGPRGGRLDSTGRFALARRDADLDLICEFLRHRSLEASLEGAEPIHLSFKVPGALASAALRSKAPLV